MPNFMYHFPSGALLGMVASLWLLALAGISLWRSKPGKRAWAIVFSAWTLILGLVEGVTSVYLLLVGSHQISEGPKPLKYIMEGGSGAVVSAVVMLALGALARRAAVLLMSSLAVLPMAGASLSQYLFQMLDAKPLALTVSLLWIVTPLMVVGFCAALLSWVLRSASGAQHRGYRSGLDDGYQKALTEFERRQREKEPSEDESIHVDGQDVAAS